MHTAYGDFTAHTKVGDFTFYPSLENIAKIGSPSEIIDTYSSVYMINFNDWLSKSSMINSSLVNQSYILYKNLALESAKLVLQSCCPRDIAPFVGEWEMGVIKMHGRAGLETNKDKILTLAKHLLFHGVNGKSENKDTNKSAKRTTEFHADHYATMARRNLSMTRDEAWSMTMTELVKEIEAMTPPKSDDNGAPTDDQYDEVMQMIAKRNNKVVNYGR